MPRWRRKLIKRLETFFHAKTRAHDEVEFNILDNPISFVMPKPDNHPAPSKGIYKRQLSHMTQSKISLQQHPHSHNRKWKRMLARHISVLLGHSHHKLELVSKGFLISKSKPFLAASLDNIKKSQLFDGCPNKVVEYKCPWKQRSTPKRAS